MILEYSNYLFKVDATKECTSIENSYRLESRKDMKEFLNLVRKDCPFDFAIYRRTIKDMIREWRTHNLLYSLGIKKDRTKTVDLEVDQSKLYKFLYAVGSLLYLKF